MGYMCRPEVNGRNGGVKKFFGYSTFRPYQKEIIEKILEGRDCLVVMATGSGKSLCYQVPPLVAKKTAVVISPLLSLMQDQVMALRQRGIKAEHLSSAQTDSSVQRNAESGQFNILYMTPEKACSISTSFWSNLLNMGICLLAVDEAHCISEWGHDFRVEYKQLGNLRNILTNVPFVGLTATATEKVRIDITDSLKMRDPYVTIGSFDRNNLFYGVKSFKRSSSFVDELVGEVSKCVANAGSTIIYCTTVKDVEQIFKSLLEAGIKAGIYHGQMNNKAREESHRFSAFAIDVSEIALVVAFNEINVLLKSFIRDESDVMVATIAFGMGIDKPNIRYVIHYGCPKSLESYYQESGRCGRDGNCDNCTTSRNESDMSREAFLLMACMRACGGNWGLGMPVDVLRGSRSKKILDAQVRQSSHFMGLGELSANWWKALGYQLISHGYLTETIRDVFKFVCVSPKGMQFLSSSKPDHQPPLVLPVTDELSGNEKPRNKLGEVKEFIGLSPLEYEGLSEAEAQLYKMLLEERMKLARAVGTAPYAICGDQTLKKIVLTRPSTKARLANIDGVNQHLLTKYGDHFLRSIQRLSQGLNLSLDDDASIQPNITKPVYTTPNQERKLTPARFEAWRMWHEDGLSFQKIANFPGRSAPVKEDTVIGYIVDAAQEGCAIDWIRFCREIALTRELFANIQAAILKVGSKDKLKPIKNELPEEISYALIKVCLAIQDLGISAEVIPPGHCRADEHSNVTSVLLPTSNHPCHTEGTREFRRSVENAVGHYTDDLLSPSKRHKVNGKEENSLAPEATESSMLSWLENYKDGVSLSDILKHFNGSTEESIVEMLSCLESEFLIFKKNNLYRLM
ncbi:hypothetical protein TEA_029406 [Camellia sinensis var. sinensis]|uniref:DNA 3'-5' helicase n=1 Tax=Camellia sinensis var. sinensis TaxID=542762 RepID=A0A4S4D0X7_CAMSN|nr:hypothetical protein TEA_029406 [Camellia sinensis var. sinensis]